MTPCLYCGTPMTPVDYDCEETCPGCGLVWGYPADGPTPMMESVRALVAAERERCVKVLEDLGHYELAQRLGG
jgi:hypothetical protein